MRQIGHLETEPVARRFQDYLLTEDIASRLEFQGGAGWAVWVEDEDKLADASARLTRFRTNPAAPEFEKRGPRAQAIRKELEKEEEAHRKKVKDRRHLFQPLSVYGFGPVTLLLMAVSIAVFVWCRFGTQPQHAAALFISLYDVDRQAPLLRHVPEIAHGEVWRLFTPMFVHFGILHIFFNMLWIRDLGSMIEARQSPFYFGVLVLVISALSNLAELYLGHGPVFGGMSGVVYGLLGYIWIRGKFDPASGLFLHPTTVTTSLVWFVACWAGFLGPIANVCHTAGLLIGMAWGWLSSLRYH